MPFPLTGARVKRICNRAATVFFGNVQTLVHGDATIGLIGDGGVCEAADFFEGCLTGEHLSEALLIKRQES